MSASKDDGATPADPASAAATGAADGVDGTQVTTVPVATTDIAVAVSAGEFAAEAQAAAVAELSGDGKPDAKPATEAADDGKLNSQPDANAADAAKPDLKTDGKPADDTKVIAANAALVMPPADTTPAIESAGIATVAATVAPDNPDPAAAQPPADLKIPHAMLAEAGKHAAKSATPQSPPAKTDGGNQQTAANAPNAPASASAAKPAADGDKQQTAHGSEQADTAHRAERFDVNLATIVRPDVSTAPDAAAAGKPPADLTQPIALTAPAGHAAAANANQPSAAATSPPQLAAVPVTGLAVEIAAKAFAGKNRFEIRLDPPELGRIEVRLDVDHNGQVTTRLLVDRADTLDLLRRDAAGLERALQDAGLKTADNGVQYSLRDHSFSRNDQPTSAPDRAQLLVSDESSPLIEATQRGYRRLAGPGGGVDIRV